MKVLSNEITFYQQINNNKKLRDAYQKRGKQGFYRIELFRVGNTHRIIRFNLFESVVHFFQSLLQKNKTPYFKLLVQKKWSQHKISWVKDFDSKQQKVHNIATATLNSAQRTVKPPPQNLAPTAKKQNKQPPATLPALQSSPSKIQKPKPPPPSRLHQT